MPGTAASVVIGIGNVFRRDDGVGWAVIEALRDDTVALPPSTELRESAGDPAQLMDMWENSRRAVVVDACFPPRPRPGRVHRWRPGAGGVPSPVTQEHSTHGLGLVHALRLAESLGRRAGDMVVYAVEGADRSMGTGLTPQVADAVRPLALRIAADLARHAGARQGP
ncbi:MULTISPECIES: hydrogenase maturation protease [unclassified Streptomyces]|uniref:hydrogenase maturation protease n=1 Tax=unclassified Streptomyces TaxID=2593676 RepID=UPI003806A739